MTSTKWELRRRDFLRGLGAGAALLPLLTETQARAQVVVLLPALLVAVTRADPDRRNLQRIAVDIVDVDDLVTEAATLLDAVPAVVDAGQQDVLDVGAGVRRGPS